MTFKKYNHTNNAFCELMTDLSSSDTTMLLQGNFNRFPTENFIVKLSKVSGNSVVARENVYVANRNNNICTGLIRAYEKVPMNDDAAENIQQALNFSAGDMVEVVVSSEFLKDIQNRLENSVEKDGGLRTGFTENGLIVVEGGEERIKDKNNIQNVGGLDKVLIERTSGTFGTINFNTLKDQILGDDGSIVAELAQTPGNITLVNEPVFPKGSTAANWQGITWQELEGPTKITSVTVQNSGGNMTVYGMTAGGQQVALGGTTNGTFPVSSQEIFVKVGIQNNNSNRLYDRVSISGTQLGQDINAMTIVGRLNYRVKGSISNATLAGELCGMKFFFKKDVIIRKIKTMSPTNSPLARIYIYNDDFTLKLGEFSTTNYINSNEFILNFSAQRNTGYNVVISNTSHFAQNKWITQQVNTFPFATCGIKPQKQYTEHMYAIEEVELDYGNKAYFARCDDLHFARFAGLASGGTKGQDIKIFTKIGGNFSGFSGISQGEFYFVGSAPGSITTQIGTHKIPVGFAVSSSALQINNEPPMQSKYVYGTFYHYGGMITLSPGMTITKGSFSYSAPSNSYATYRIPQGVWSVSQSGNIFY